MRKGEIVVMEKAALKLNQVIKESEEYSQYQTTMVRLMEHQELYQAVNVFRRRNCELQGYDDGVNRYQEINNLGLEYEKVLRNPIVNEFLVAEQVLSRKLIQVYETVVDGLELDYSYME